MPVTATKVRVKVFPDHNALQKFLKDGANNVSIIYSVYSNNNGGHVLVYEVI